MVVNYADQTSAAESAVKTIEASPGRALAVQGRLVDAAPTTPAGSPGRSSASTARPCGDPVTDRDIVLAALAELNETVGRRRLDDVVELFEPDAVLIGSARHNGTRAEIREYLHAVLAQPVPLSWEWDEASLATGRTDGTIWFSILGDAILDQRQPMRLSGVLRSQGDGTWLWSQFHGSVAET